MNIVMDFKNENDLGWDGMALINSTKWIKRVVCRSNLVSNGVNRKKFLIARA